MSILVTGSSGMIGTRLCQKFLEKNIEFVGIDGRRNFWDKEVQKKTIIGDLRNQKTFKKVKQPIDCIIHLAARARVITSIENPAEAIENLQSTFAVLEFARQNSIKKFILASSKEVYGSTEKKSVKESDFDISLNENPYSASKIGCEALTFSYQNSYGLQPVVLRFSNVYGLYVTNLRAIPILINKALLSQKITIFGKDKKLDFIYVDDIVDGILKVLKKYPKLKKQAFNLGFGKATSIEAIANEIESILDIKLQIKIVKNRPGEIMHFSANTQKIRSITGFVPQVSLRRGLEKTIAWYRDEKVQKKLKDIHS